MIYFNLQGRNVLFAVVIIPIMQNMTIKEKDPIEYIVKVENAFRTKEEAEDALRKMEDNNGI